MIGIDSNTWLVYEGVSNYGHGIWPTPVLSIATLITSEADWETLPSSSHLDKAKPNEQKRYNTRPPTDEDAQLVLSALGFLLREVGWAR